MADQESRKKLNFLDCMGFCIGQIIGSGIMVLTGIVIGITGHGTPFAFMGAAVLAIMVMLPSAFLASAIPSSGAGYSYVKRLLGERAGFFYVCMFVITQVLIATYAKGLASYFVSIFPSFSETAVAMTVLCIAVVINLIGLKSSALIQNCMVAFLLLSLLLFIALGLPKVEWAVLAPSFSNVMPGGIKNFLTGIALLSFAAGGAKFVAENGDDIKNPGKTIPRAMITSTLLVSVFYALVGIVASGVLPLEKVAFENLTQVAREIFPPWMYIFFVFGGAIFALMTTLNGTLSWVTRSLQAASKEGWLPNIFARENRGGTPVLLLVIFALAGALPILFGLELGTIAKMGIGLDMLCEFMILVACFRLPSRFPREHADAHFRVRGKVFYVLLGIVGLLMLGTSYINLSDLTGPIYVVIAVYLAFIAALTLVRHRYMVKARDVT
ncbi:MAG: APC family permease [Treponema sp.]|nr:APC family permease [Treponema sp.]